MTNRSAALALESLRCDLINGREAIEVLAECDKVGQWLAKQKNSKMVSALLREAFELSDKCNGGSGNVKTRLVIE